MAFVVLLYFLFIVGLLAFAIVSLWWMIHVWTSPQRVRGSSFVSVAAPAGRSLSFSLLVPARHEQAVLEQTLTGLAQLRYPRYEVLTIVGHDDAATMAVAARVAARFPLMVKLVIDPDPGSKPGALNAALPHVRGDVVGIFDAEDEVHPDLLTHVDREFRSTDADVVQAGVQLMNHDSSWYALRNVLEYYFHFRSRLHRYSEMGLVPLGGNTVFARTEGAEGLDGPHRVLVSRVSRMVARALFPRVHPVHDPLAGFFACRRSVVAGAHLRPVGFKILLELLVRGSWRTVREVPYSMSPRTSGASSASWREGLRFGTHLLRLRLTT